MTIAEGALSELEFEETEEASEEEALQAPHYEIFSYPADTTLKGYLDQWRNEQLFVPPFQRNYVWDQTRASKLVESFLLGLPVPPVFLFKPAGGKNFWIIDGQQRIRSIVDFQKGLFGESKFRLKGVDSRWLGKTFEELEEGERFTLETSVLRAVVIQQTDPKDHSSIFHIFERLNTGGLRLNAMEVRQCVYQSAFLSELKAVNEKKSWRDLLGLPKPDKRLKDVELLLRVVALCKDFEHYEKPMKGFLNACALEYALEDSKPPGPMNSTVNALIDAIDQIAQALGPRPFHLKGRLNYSALDATLVTAMRVGSIPDLAEKYKKLVQQEKFIEAVSFNTSDEAVVKERITLALKTLSVA
ncbi:Protein of unknown function DUF262 [Bradyrhizobium sp. NFR13]|uniref:GmrSD restriction endonuclease domain-containing protein n=1 Tax=Bradyrhizobium sp. NFR13 TaxID=1566285 RepID=UPI0008E1CD74|nr:DUF262 domain-containing protein [Bradyrhizobium sp. NFR13]SFM08570.1 Protein of unknown function DUF262 [Bradyrhizobium sp. NFR13]